ncbi:hypothetical protein J5J10_12370 [Ciceribacter sp. L1K23]|nr:hypothetical protein [Ciceribacter sp. L1K23]
MTGGLTNISAKYGSPANASFRFNQPFTLGKAEVYLRLTTDGTPHEIVINQSTLDRALQRSNATVSTIDDYALVLGLAFADAGSGYSAEVTTSWPDNVPRVTIQGNPAVHHSAGQNSTVALKFQYADWGMGLSDIDVTGSESLDAMLRSVERMLSSTTAAAATLGAVQARIDMQADFVATLTDSIDNGIGRLVDADMNEASTRLKALQTQEQLAIQSLSIANSNSENILALFR